MGKENFDDFIKDHGAEFEEIEGNAEEESIKEEEFIKEEVEEGIEELVERELKDPTELTKINIFRGFVSNLIEELEEDPDILEKSAYLKAVYEGIEQRAHGYGHARENEEIRREAQDALDQINDLVNN